MSATTTLNCDARFDIDLRYGKERELAFVAALETVEVKSDKRAAETGNVFIEYAQHGRPSGLNVSTATHWAIEVRPDVWVLMTRGRVRELAARAWADESRRRFCCGDNENDGVLVPVAWLLS